MNRPNDDQILFLPGSLHVDPMQPILRSRTSQRLASVYATVIIYNVSVASYQNPKQSKEERLLENDKMLCIAL